MLRPVGSLAGENAALSRKNGEQRRRRSAIHDPTASGISNNLFLVASEAVCPRPGVHGAVLPRLQGWVFALTSLLNYDLKTAEWVKMEVTMRFSIENWS